MNNEPNLGPCCACAGTENVRNIVGLGKLLPEAYRGQNLGMGCVTCGQPTDEAVVVLCDDCLGPPMAEPKEIHAGDKRIPYSELSNERCYHDLKYHPEIWPEHSRLVQINGFNLLAFADSPDAGPDCLCSLCAGPIEGGVPIRAYLDPEPVPAYELRFHHHCFEHTGLIQQTTLVFPLS